MPVIGTYNGANILAFPSKPGLRQIQVDMVDTVAKQTSPFTQVSQFQAFPGGDFWTGTITLPQMAVANAAVWSAFLAACRGMQNVFPLGHPLFRKPAGKIQQGTKPVISGVNAPMTYTLQTRGWHPNSANLLLPGDRLQIGTVPNNASAPGLCRLHMVTDPVHSDAGGNAMISVWPSLREATTDGEALVLSNPQGLFRLADNKRSVLTTESRLSGMSFSIMEAR
jgi:hypothetical protein